MDRIGFIGLGNMGAPMAHRLIEAGYDLYVMDKSTAVLDRFLAGHACHSLEPDGQGPVPDALITMLPDGKAVADVLTGAGGMAQHLEPGAVVIDMSSSSAVGTRSLAASLSENQIDLMDAPVSGGVKKAVDGSLAIMAGGDESRVEQCRPLLETLGTVYYTGAAGSGHAMKALNNYLSAASLASASEAVLAGHRFGLDPARMIEILNVSSGRSNSTENKFPNFILNEAYDSGFGIGLLAKDLLLAQEVMTTSGSPSRLLGTCAELWQTAAEQLGSLADHTEYFRFIESWDQPGGKEGS